MYGIFSSDEFSSCLFRYPFFIPRIFIRSFFSSGNFRPALFHSRFRLAFSYVLFSSVLFVLCIFSSKQFCPCIFHPTCLCPPKAVVVSCWRGPCPLSSPPDTLHFWIQFFLSTEIARSGGGVGATQQAMLSEGSDPANPPNQTFEQKLWKMPHFSFVLFIWISFRTVFRLNFYACFQADLFLSYMFRGQSQTERNRPEPQNLAKHSSEYRAE